MQRSLFLVLMLVTSMQTVMAQTHRVAVMKPLDRESKVPYPFLLAVRTQLSSAIANTAGYEAYTRSDLDVLADEFKFQEIGPVSEDQRRKIGEMSGADLACISEVAFDGKMYVITASIVELESGKVVSSAVEIVEDNMTAVNNACISLGRRLLKPEVVDPKKDAFVYPGFGNFGRTERPRSDSLELAQMVNTHLDHILLMNGEIIDTRVLGQSTLEVRYLEFGKNGSSKERAEPTETVFSVTDSVGRERIWYFVDTAFGNDLTIDEMRWFIKGEQDARKGHKPRWLVWGGFVFGAGTTIAANLEVNSFFLPPLYAGAMILPRVHVTKGSITDLTMEGNEHYAYGYAKVGKSKRVVRSLISTFAGVAVGLVVRQVFINPNLEGYN